MDLFLTWAYWFNSRPSPLTDLGQFILIGIIVLSLAFAIILYIEAYPHRFNHYRFVLNRLRAFFIANIVIAGGFLFINSQIVPVLRARIWYIVWGLALIGWVWLILHLEKKRRSKKTTPTVRDEEIKKYLPK